MPTLRPHERLVGTHDAFHVNNAKQCSLQPSDNGHGHTWPAKGTLFGTIAGAHTMYSYRVLFLKTNTPRDGARHKGSSTAGWLKRRTKRSIVDNATSGHAPTPRAWSIETGQCSAARTPPRAVPPWRWRDQEAARSDRRDAPSSVPVTSQWHAQDGAGQPARTAWPPRRHPGRGSS